MYVLHMLRAVVRINHDNVASRGAVGRTHTVVRLQRRIRRKDGTENFGGFVYVLDRFPQRDFGVVGFYVPDLFQCVSFPGSLPQRGLPRPTALFSGYHAEGYHARTYICNQANGLPRLQGYHTRATTLQTNFWVQAGNHTCG